MIAATHTEAEVGAVSRTQVVGEALKVLQRNGYFQGRWHCIHMEESEGRLVLHGRLPSFYLKQVLQTVLRDVEGVREIDNRVLVD